MGRKRRPAAETKAAILEVAGRMLQEGGPTSIRLDDVAAELQMSRQAVLHHFGSRDGLLRAVVERAWLGLFGDLADLARSADGMQPEAFVDLVDDVVRARGNARLGAWLLLSESGLDASVFEGALAVLPAAIQQRRAPLAGASVDETRDGLLLVAAALFGDAIFGERLRQSLGAEDGEEERRRFRRWIAHTLWQDR